ncbi:MAG: 23S rRNA (guanosine(2251)-2'-O)-methyltransferase RlmB [Muribaculaceae bacterium]|nr:23S rRNA (guanosine(2251)-2'-O)-methyltransferase RlmB [Muribaculaceae bacterium]MDE5971572.1 23S rRNA (guanosine(2251)-2'-O)-methyltransferase RlmB [Muribaculaceae bacterium]
MQKSEYIFGIRAVMEAIQAGRDIDKVLIKKELRGDLIAELIDMLKLHRIPVKRVPLQTIDRITRKNHQGVVAVLCAVTYHRLDHLVPQLYEEGRLPFVIVLDGITDVRNFGAIARTAECVGADAIVIPEHGSVSVGADAVKTSAGALHHIPVCRSRSASLAVRFLKENGYKIVAVTEKADTNYTAVDYTGPIALVMGAEDIGISADIISMADAKAAIPMFGEIGSLNVSVAAGVMMYEVVRQRLLADLDVI